MVSYTTLNLNAIQSICMILYFDRYARSINLYINTLKINLNFVFESIDFRIKNQHLHTQIHAKTAFCSRKLLTLLPAIYNFTCEQFSWMDFIHMCNNNNNNNKMLYFQNGSNMLIILSGYAYKQHNRRKFIPTTIAEA